MTKRNTVLTAIAPVTLLAATATQAAIVTDGGFEGGPGGGNWTEFSTNFGTPICDVGSCGTGDLGPHGGTYWAWLGGIDADETAYVSQALTIPATGGATLDFWLAIPAADNIGTDTFNVLLDGNTVFVTSNFDPFANVLSYALHTIDVSAYADGGVHTLRFEGQFTSQGVGVTNFFVDDVSLSAVPVPAAVWLLGSALAVLAWLRRKTVT